MNKHNKKDIRHGYWEFKTIRGVLVCKSTCNNGKNLGYLEMHYHLSCFYNNKIYRKEINI